MDKAEFFVSHKSTEPGLTRQDQILIQNYTSEIHSKRDTVKFPLYTEPP